jgi:hypothetical protein
MLVRLRPKASLKVTTQNLHRSHLLLVVASPSLYLCKINWQNFRRMRVGTNQVRRFLVIDWIELWQLCNSSEALHIDDIKTEVHAFSYIYSGRLFFFTIYGLVIWSLGLQKTIVGSLLL